MRYLVVQPYNAVTSRINNGKQFACYHIPRIGRSFYRDAYGTLYKVLDTGQVIRFFK